MAIRTHNTPRPDGRTCIPNFRPHSVDRSAYFPRVPLHILGDLVNEVTPAEIRALHYLADNADLIVVEGETFLLAPAPIDLIDTLALVGSQQADLEPVTEDESETDRGVDDEASL